MTTNYERGYAFERAVRKYLEKQGHLVIRSAGSRGPADLVAWDCNFPGESPFFIQCKTDEKGIQEDIDKFSRCIPYGPCYFVYKRQGHWFTRALLKSVTLSEEYEFRELFEVESEEDISAAAD